jgi:hypothetical protein
MPPPNNPFKHAFLVGGCLAGVVLMVVALTSSSVYYAIVGALVLGASLVGLRGIRQGRNPWYVRAPLDYWWQKRRGPRPGS